MNHHVKIIGGLIIGTGIVSATFFIGTISNTLYKDSTKDVKASSVEISNPVPTPISIEKAYNTNRILISPVIKDNNCIFRCSKNQKCRLDEESITTCKQYGATGVVIIGDFNQTVEEVWQK
jgi:hypothetical protein